MVPAAGRDTHRDAHRCRSCHLCPALGLQVVEIASLTDHLLTECDKRDGFGRCYRCSEAVPKDELPRHVKSKDCHRECPRGGRHPAPASPTTHGATGSCLADTISAAKPEKLANRCPLCHENFAPGEEVRLRGQHSGSEQCVWCRPGPSAGRGSARGQVRGGSPFPSGPCPWALPGGVATPSLWSPLTHESEPAGRVWRVCFLSAAERSSLPVRPRCTGRVGQASRPSEPQTWLQLPVPGLRARTCEPTASQHSSQAMAFSTPICAASSDLAARLQAP